MVCIIGGSQTPKCLSWKLFSIKLQGVSRKDKTYRSLGFHVHIQHLETAFLPGIILLISKLCVSFNKNIILTVTVPSHDIMIILCNEKLSLRTGLLVCLKMLQFLLQQQSRQVEDLASLARGYKCTVHASCILGK